LPISGLRVSSTDLRPSFALAAIGLETDFRYGGRRYDLTTLDRFSALHMRQSPRHPRAAKTSTKTAHRLLPAWKLQDAKAHFSQVVREAREQGPQRVTLHGKDAMVVLSAEDYARLVPAATQPSLHALLSGSPLRDLDFEHGSVRAPVRDAEL
jgi:antitoxin Phd